MVQFSFSVSVNLPRKQQIIPGYEGVGLQPHPLGEASSHPHDEGYGENEEQRGSNDNQHPQNQGKNRGYFLSASHEEAPIASPMAPSQVNPVGRAMLSSQSKKMKLAKPMQVMSSIMTREIMP